jgi:hypothetical protein
MATSGDRGVEPRWSRGTRYDCASFFDSSAFRGPGKCEVGKMRTENETSGALQKFNFLRAKA